MSNSRETLRQAIVEAMVKEIDENGLEVVTDESARKWQTAQNLRQMNKPLEIYWKDKSGTRHRFWIYRRGTEFNEPCPGIYIYTRETSPHKWIPIYIGQAENVNARLTNQEQRERVDQNGATHIHVSIIAKEKSRLTIAKDLINQWNPVCNGQYTNAPQGLTVEEVADVNPEFLVRDRNGEIHAARCDAVSTLLLKELLKEHRKIEELEANATQQRKDFQAAIAHEREETQAAVAQLNQRVQKVSARLEMSRLVPQMTVTNQQTASEAGAILAQQKPTNAERGRDCCCTNVGKRRSVWNT